MKNQSQPSADNDYLHPHLLILHNSLQHWTGRSLLDTSMNPAETARAIYEAPFVLLSHSTEADPIFNYANQCAQRLFQLGWDEFVQMPSRLSAEAPNREAREQLLEQVSTQGYIDNYRGIRIAATGQRFYIEQALVWNLLDGKGNHHGQAAMFGKWSLI